MVVWNQIKLRSTPGLRLDSEYYQPDYLDLLAKLQSISPSFISDFALVTDGIHSSPDWVEEGGITYLSAKCVKDNYFVLTQAGQISQKQNALNPRTQARLGDVLLTTVGTIGNAAVVYEDILPANMDRHLGIIRIREDVADIDPYYLATFLNSKFGRFQTLREATGNVQLNLFIEKIKKLLVPTGREFNEVGALTRRAYDLRYKAKALYDAAQEVLLIELGVSNVNSFTQVSNTVTSSEALKAHRLDAEYFQPKYYQLVDAIHHCSYPYKALDMLIEPISNGFDFREFSEQGTPYIRVGDIKNGSISLESAEKVPINQRDISKNISLKVGNVLFTRKGSFGNAAVVRLGQEHAIISSEIMLLRLLNKIEMPVLPDYLALFLNSPLGYWQVERRVHGMAYYSISQADLAKVEIIIPTLPIQELLAEKVQQSLVAEQDARQLLEEANHQIEKLVEGNEGA